MGKLFQTDRHHPPLVNTQALPAAEIFVCVELSEKARLIPSQRNAAEAIRRRSANRQTICRRSRFHEPSRSPRSQMRTGDIEDLAETAGATSANKLLLRPISRFSFRQIRIWEKVIARSLAGQC
jgi:hypothetical protein